MGDNLHDRLKARLAEPPPPALDRARAFLAYHVHGADRELLEMDAKNSPAAVIDGVEAIEEVLAVPQEPGTLYRMVAYDGNRMLDDETDATAAAWLKRLTQDLRTWLGEHAPAEREPSQPM